MNLYRAFGKRLLDLVIAVPAVIVGSPLFVIVAVLVRIKLGSPVIFSQVRPGRNEKPFTIYKFRSMLDEYTSDGRQLTQTERLTKFGRLIRSTSLDELPELFNVIKGEMSLVGPRPLLMEYIGYYTPGAQPPPRGRGPASPAGPRSRAATRCSGASASTWTSGTWTT